MRTYSTRRAAKLIGVHHITLHHWIHNGVVKPSIAVRMDGRTLHRWTEADLEKARRVKAKRRRGPKPTRK